MFRNRESGVAHLSSKTTPPPQRCPCSSVWIERQPTTLRVEGSSPSRGTTATTARRFASWGSQG